jgi:hypothetical protein
MNWHDDFIDLVKGATKQNSFWNYQIDRAIRGIHSKVEFPITSALEKQIREIGETPPEKMSEKSKKPLNRKFKELGINDDIQIEHMISVRDIIKEIWSLKAKNPNPTPEMIRTLMNQKTNCIYKLRKKEKELHG